MYAVKQEASVDLSLVARLRDAVVVVGRTRPRSTLLAMLTIKKRDAWLSISMHACGSVPMVMVLRLAALRSAGAPL